MAIADIAAKLAQDPRNRIVKVVWSPLGGMLFLWASWISTGKTLPPLGIAKVSGLPAPWKDFDLFDRNNDQVDPDKALRKLPEGHVEPISDVVLNKYLQWTPQPAISTQKDEKTPGDTIYYATTGLEFDDADTYFAPNGQFNLCGEPQTNGSSQGASFLRCNSTVIGDMIAFGIPVPGDHDGSSSDRSRVERFVSSILAWAARVGSPWPAAFSTFHVASLDLSAAKTTVTRRQQGVIIINLKKLRKYQPAPSPGSKRPDTMSFNIEASAGVGSWNLEAWTISAVGPPKGDGFRSFPLQAGNLHPDWDHNSSPRGPGTSPQASANYINASDGPSVDVKVDLVTLDVTMKLNGRSNPPREG